MKVELRAGAEVDLASGSEVRELGDRLAHAIKTLNDGAITERATALIVTDAAGNVGTPNPTVLYRCPQGFTARLYRWGIASPAATPAAPITTGQMQFYVDAATPQGLQLFLPVSGIVAPVVLTDSRHNAVYLRDGESLVVTGAGLPVTTQFGVNFTLILYPATKGGVD